MSSSPPDAEFAIHPAASANPGVDAVQVLPHAAALAATRRVTSRAEVDDKHRVLRDAVLALGRTPVPAAPLSDDAESCAPDRGVPDSARVRPVAREAHEPHEARGGWGRYGRARERVHLAVVAYAHALHHDGTSRAAVALCVTDTLDEARAGLPVAVLAAVRRDAAQCCLDAWYAH